MKKYDSGDMVAVFVVGMMTAWLLQMFIIFISWLNSFCMDTY